MAYNFTTFQAALSVETNIPQTNAGFIAIVPTIIDQAEGMIYREPGLEFLSTVGSNDAGFTTPDTQFFTLPVFFTTIDSVNRVDGNNRPPLTKISRPALERLYPMRISSGPTAVPVKWAPFTDQIIMLAPTPGGNTQMEITGKIRPANMSVSNPSPWLWTHLGDLAFAAAMVMMSGYMRNFGSQADDPKMATSWKMIYDDLLPGAKSEESRRKFEAA
jgi:hypothetical protein